MIFYNLFKFTFCNCAVLHSVTVTTIWWLQRGVSTNAQIVFFDRSMFVLMWRQIQTAHEQHSNQAYHTSNKFETKPAKRFARWLSRWNKSLFGKSGYWIGALKFNINFQSTNLRWLRKTRCKNIILRQVTVQLNWFLKITCVRGGWQTRGKILHNYAIFLLSIEMVLTKYVNY